MVLYSQGQHGRVTDMTSAGPKQWAGLKLQTLGLTPPKQAWPSIPAVPMTILATRTCRTRQSLGNKTACMRRRRSRCAALTNVYWSVEHQTGPAHLICRSLYLCACSSHRVILLRFCHASLVGMSNLGNDFPDAVICSHP